MTALNRKKEQLKKRIDDLEEALAMGVLTVKSPSGRLVTYQSPSDLRKTISDLKRELDYLINGKSGAFGTVIGFRRR
ncbi:MAG: hypothetical protein GX667_09365 [Xanthomonadaceae bacterium]|nr:hypothetical protein [Xanthomonadaceae bacterium]